ncbi:preprotein translocase subunit SecG [Sphingomonas sp. SUN019]|uniref:preprotein translocase subunit SecG n=1 Tax=Sphingomonas sp. SUN019 TaxID=2937788 RepID=UPI00216415F1|nr:preprotein translocase subunit SecG [Sphingomonas sp. SUN019]UVO49437.1 preprotein translocase subunit SecG [Sphingomonas sp. SUN019]
MFTFLLVLHIIITAALVTVVLMQRSEGGGLTSGGSPSGLMSARGASDFLTRATAVLGTLFILLSIALAAFAASRGGTSVDTSLQRTVPAAAPAATAPPSTGDAPFAGAAQNAAAAAGGNQSAPANTDNGVPLAN